VGLVRDGPGVMLRDLRRGDPKAQAVIATLQEIAPDIVLLTGIDWDHGGALVSALAEQVALYPHHLSLRPNAGLPSGIDLDGDGRLGGRGTRWALAAIPAKAAWRCCRGIPSRFGPTIRRCSGPTCPTRFFSTG
jgi:hypothetical protein